MKVKFLKDYQFIGNYPGDGSDTTVHTGDVIDLEHTESAKWLIDNGFAEKVKESGWWKPKASEEYYYLAASGEVYVDSWVNGGLDELRYSMGECFKTEKAAEAWRDYRTAIATVRQDEGVLTPREIESTERSNGAVYCITYTFDSGLFVHTCRLAMVLPQVGAIYFNSRGYAQASLGKHPDEWKIIANYDWSRE